MSNTVTIPVTVRASVSRPHHELRRALNVVLNELQLSRGLALSLDLARELQTPVEAVFSAPVSLTVMQNENGDFVLDIAAPTRRRNLFPAFFGTLGIWPAGAESSIAILRGAYSVPSAAVAEKLDMAFLRQAAHSSLRQFLEILMQDSARHAPV